MIANIPRNYKQHIDNRCYPVVERYIALGNENVKKI